MLDRYIYAVKILLPLNKRDDIAEEIRSNLLSLIEEQEALSGRELNPEELSAIVRQNGHPVLVAGRYRDAPFRSLIGPALLPLYWFTLRAVLLLVVAINLIVAAFLFAKSPHPGATVLHLCGNIWLGGVSTVGWITVLFAVWEHWQVKFRWNPQSLPAMPRRRAEPKPVVQIVAGAVALVLWTFALYSPRTILLGGNDVFDLSPAWYAMRLPMLLLAAFGIARACMKLTRFASAEWLPLVRIGINISGVALLIFLLRAGDLLVPGTHWDAARFGVALGIVNQIVYWTLLCVCLFSALMCLHELRGYLRRRRTPTMLAV